MAISTSRAGIIRIGEFLRNSGWALGWAVNESQATRKVRQSRQRCRAIRAGPETPPRRIIEMSDMAAKPQRLAMIRPAWGGCPFSVPVGLARAWLASIAAVAPTPRMNSSARGSKRPMRPGGRITAAHPVAVR